MSDDPQWEDVASPVSGDYLERIRVPGGWLYRQIYSLPGATILLLSLAFVPDPNHEPL